MPLLSIRKYAEHRNISHTAVQKAIKQGRIHLTPDGRIDVDQADRDWERNTSPVNSPESRSAALATTRKATERTDLRAIPLEISILTASHLTLYDCPMCPARSCRYILTRGTLRG